METTLMKRRQMLQFTLDANEVGIDSYQFTFSWLKSKVGEGSLVQNGLAGNLDKKEFLTSIHGIGPKSVECISLLTLQNIAFPISFLLFGK